MGINKTLLKSFLGGTAIAAILPVTAAYAQVDEITITATRRDESIQDVPISATAYSDDDLDRLRILSTQDIGKQAPNINLVQGNFGFGAPIISVRGVTNGDFSATSNTPVTVYSDDVVLTNIVSQGFGIYDLERVELLRGPQGTLFGRNSTSGALQFFSAKPTKEFSYGASASIATHDDMIVEGFLSGPLSDTVQGRFSFNTRNRDGVVENVATGRDEFEIDYWSVRGILTAQPSDRLDIMAKVQLSESSGTGVVFHNSIGDNPFNTPFLVEPGGDAGEFEQISLDLPNRPEQVEQTDITLKGDLQLDNGWTLTGVFGYVDLEFEEFNDDDATTVASTHEYANRQVEQMSAEFRLAGEIGRADVVAGVFFMNEETDSIGAFEFTDDPFVGTLATNNLFSSFFLPVPFGPTDRLVTTTELSQDLDAFAIFGHAQIPLTDRLSASVGLRYSEDEKDIEVFDGNISTFNSSDPFAYGQSVQNNPLFTNYVDLFGILPYEPAGLVTGSTSADAVSGEFTLEYAPNDDAMIYGSYRRGFKGSSFASASTSTLLGVVPEVPEESVDAFEIGAKTSWNDNRLVVNGAAFFYTYEDFQAFEFLEVGGFLTNFLFSIPEVEIKGLELEVEANPVDNLNFNFGIGLLDTEITDANVQLPPGVALTIAQGNEIRNAPEVNFNGAVSYDIPIANGKYFLTPAANYTHVGEYFSDFINTPAGAQFPFDLDGDTVPDFAITADNGSLAGDYGQLDLSLTLSEASGKYALTLFGQNVTDEVQVTGRFPGNFGNGGTDFATVNDGNRELWGIKLDIAN